LVSSSSLGGTAWQQSLQAQTFRSVVWWGSETGNAWILAWLTESDSVFQMNGDKMIQQLFLGHLLKWRYCHVNTGFLTWSKIHQSKGLVMYMYGSSRDRGSGAGMCGVRPGKRVSF
jgi:hypothetical protein